MEAMLEEAEEGDTMVEEGAAMVAVAEAAATPSPGHPTYNTIRGLTTLTGRS